MERIKDISKVILPGGHILVRVYEKEKSKIIMPDNSDKSAQADYAEVVQVSKDIEDLKPGDVVIDFSTSNAFKWEDKTYAIVFRHQIMVAVDKEYFAENLTITE